MKRCQFFTLVNRPERTCPDDVTYYVVFNDGVRHACCTLHTDLYRDMAEDICQKQIFTKVPVRLRKEVAGGVIRYILIEETQDGAR